MDLIEQHIRLKLQAYTEMLELACERMLVSDSGGVLAVWHPNGNFSISLDPSVPWGTIHEHQEFSV